MSNSSHTYYLKLQQILKAYLVYSRKQINTPRTNTLHLLFTQVFGALQK